MGRADGPFSPLGNPEERPCRIRPLSRTELSRPGEFMSPHGFAGRMAAPGVRGFAPVERRLHVREELRRLRRNPLKPLLRSLGAAAGEGRIHMTELGRCAIAYEFYFQSLARFLPEMSVVLRWRLGPYFARKYRVPYTPGQAKLARRYHEIAPYVEMDLVNCVIHARALMDHVAPLSRRFLPNRGLPVRSFHAHRDFFVKRTEPFGDHEEYAEYMRTRTLWFDDLREIRDKFFVHPGPEHLRVFGVPSGDSEAGMAILTGNASDPRRQDAVLVSVPRLARQIDDFLRWFSNYGLRALESRVQGSVR